MPTPSQPSSGLLVVCLCAQWCGSCREYRATFDEIAQAHPEARFRWVDIEDEAELVDPVEVENFPTLLVAAGDGVRFFGPLLPHRGTLNQLLRAQADATHPILVRNEQVVALADRLSM